jgi:hypothetical protein
MFKGMSSSVGTSIADPRLNPESNSFFSSSVPSYFFENVMEYYECFFCSVNRQNPCKNKQNNDTLRNSSLFFTKRSKSYNVSHGPPPSLMWKVKKKTLFSNFLFFFIFARRTKKISRLRVLRGIFFWKKQNIFLQKKKASKLCVFKTDTFSFAHK